MKQKPKQRKRKHTQATQKRHTIPHERGMIRGRKVAKQHKRTGLITKGIIKNTL